MKIPLVWVMVIALGAAVAGNRLDHVSVAFHRAQSMSVAGQTLTNLSRALESEKVASGEYPPSLITLKVVPQDGGDHSPELLRQIVYRKTESGFVAFVGMPGVAYIEPGQACAFQMVK